MYKALSPGAIGVKLPFEECVALAKKHGFEGIYFDVRWAAELGVEKARAALQGLKPAGFGLPFDHRIDTTEFTQNVLALPELAAVAKELGCTRCSTWVPSWHDSLEYGENFLLHKRRFQWICEVFSNNGINFGLEFIGTKTLRDGHKFEFIHDMPEMLRLCFEIGTGNAGLLLDSWHWHTSGGTVDDIAKLKANQVVDVHINDAPAGVPLDQLKDGERAMPGETGVIDVKGFLQALDRIFYKGPVMVEPFSERVRQMQPEEAIAAAAEAMNSVWPA